MRKLTLARLPIYGCAGFILFLFLANVWNAAVETDWPKLRIRSASPLAGVARPKPAPWSFDAFLSGETQKVVSSNIGRKSPVFPISVRAKNQLVFSLVGESAAPGVVIGRNGQLYEQIYIDEFCRRGLDAPVAPERVARWAESIRVTQDILEAAGKRFVYLISPSKAARYPQDLPPGACASRAVAAVPQDNRANWLAALREKGVRFVDGAALVAARQPEFPLQLFPRGGTHWNNLAAALALREMGRVSPSPLGDLAFDWAYAPEPLGTDRDLTDLLNLLWPDLTYPTPVVERAGAPASCEKTPKLVALGGSFLNQILIAATRAPCPPSSNYWFYMRTETLGVELGHYFRAPGETGKGESRPASIDDLARDVREADVVLLEENEANIGLTSQIGDLLSVVKR